MRNRGFLLAVLLTVVACGVGGCVAAAIGAGAGTVAYIRGDLEAIESAKLDAVYKATEKAVEKLELNLISKSKDAMSAVVVVRDAEDKKIAIRLKATSEGATKISIRIGLFGDETKSRMIYEKIKSNL